MIDPPDVSRRSYLFPAPAKPLRSLLDFKARAGEEFSEEEAALDVMLALDRDDLRPLRYLAKRWGWSKNRVHRGLDDLRATAAEWRSFYSDDEPDPGQSVGQAGTGVGQAGTETGPNGTARAGSGTGVGQAGTGVGQYRSDPDTRYQKNQSPPTPPGGGEDRKRKAKPKGPPPLPDWIDPGLWTEWEAHRREIGKTLKPTTTKHQINALDKLRTDGHDPNAVIRQSLANGWTGLFAIKAGRGGASRQPLPTGANYGAVSDIVDAALGLG